ncbi:MULTISPECIES: SctD/MshK family protein [Bradyrhizobium]|uniref:Type III secretion protein D n=1 Tax=Bradyrhizobium septentrionale TaxID=1404411 RepID=A0A973VW11_9BRAD|nr:MULTISPECIES: hypothetical protein [Bradyrhizobium]QIG97835.1 hypothetical protein G6P99_39735 [Bradyrhizobium sp. 6(2017)]UGY20315.1 FHA domain-containing protein [Bradyrhizobium septentrionale]UGY29145.1 FHA domain-containing protein [Bradyrhizobium septentrionale]
MSESISLEFEVLSGLYAGLRGKAAIGASLIGSGLDADLIFFEQGLEPRHLRITPHTNSIEIEALAANIRLDGRENMPPGERVSVPLPAVVHVGAMSIRWSTQDLQQGGSSNRSFIWIVVLSLVLLSSMAIGAVSPIFAPDDSAVTPSTDASSVADIAAKPAINRLDAKAADATAELLRQEVERGGLLNIKVGSGHGVVTAEGTVTPALGAKWQEIQQWFDHQTNGTPALVNAVTVKDEKAPPSISVQAVWRGSERYLLIGGQKYFVGALLSNGWTVDRIEDGRVLLSRNGRFAALPY